MINYTLGVFNLQIITVCQTLIVHARDMALLRFWMSALFGHK